MSLHHASTIEYLLCLQGRRARLSCEKDFLLSWHSATYACLCSVTLETCTIHTTQKSQASDSSTSRNMIHIPAIWNKVLGTAQQATNSAGSQQPLTQVPFSLDHGWYGACPCTCTLNVAPSTLHVSIVPSTGRTYEPVVTCHHAFFAIGQTFRRPTSCH